MLVIYKDEELNMTYVLAKRKKSIICKRRRSGEWQWNEEVERTGGNKENGGRLIA